MAFTHSVSDRDKQDRASYKLQIMGTLHQKMDIVYLRVPEFIMSSDVKKLSQQK